ncbi:ensconsin-like isoform X13 [Macrosteles quadrilineatus]|uniref:ensconsin-like isoform X13 n=1 Tax=Macrosteles quadrilineatus TaxID=74068 RepID=UPI0023E28A60|nr:ensconsin-like isoform X13 [Macrosteles quadrilineatus]
MGMDQERDDERGLSPSALAKLRGILVSSLSRENLSPVDLSGSALDEDIPLAPARRRRKVHFSESKSVDCLERAGAAPDAQRNSRPPSAKQGGSLHWFAHGADEPVLVNKHSGNTWLPDDTVSQVYDGSLPLNQGKENAASQRDREERLRILKEKQNEERQRKLDELKQQALAAQKFREQKEEERRRRMEELRLRDTDRRHQVEERKRQIWEAERDRREAILRKNQEREIRMETKRRNERSSIVFAFGSSTPRMLEPADTGGSYWATRRATSTSNVMMLSMSAAPGPLTRRSSERELDGSKKRATSAGGINRAKQPDGWRTSIYDVFQWDNTQNTHLPSHNPPFGEEDREEREVPDSGTVTPVPPAGTPSSRANRRRTDLMPTMPSPRDRPYSARSPGVRSGDVTPSRPTSSLSMSSGAAMSMSSSVHAAFKPRPTPPARRPRPFSIAVTGVTSENSTAASTPTRHSLSAEHRAAKSPAPAPDKDKPPLPKVHVTKKPSTPKQPIEALKKPTDKVKSTKSSASPTPKATPLQSPGVETAETTVKTTVTATETVTVNGDHVTTETVSVTVSSVEVPETQTKPQEVRQEVVSQPQETVKQEVTKEQLEPATNLAECDMTASMLAKTRITTEEEAKAALAEKRRLAREQAEREAELERQRLEAERLAEEQRLREEEEEQRRMEEEQLRLLEEARQAEQERLRKAIEEKQKREEEERLQREEEERQKREKEEAERKAREEAERQRQEMEIRLKKEEEDRLLRRKRVEVIMARTRKATSANNTPTKEDGDDSPGEEPRKVNDQEQFLHSERSHSAANSTNSTNQNGHQNGVDNVVEQKNVTNNLLDLSIEGDGLGVSPLPQPITEQILTPSTNTATATNGKLVNEDSVNFNTSSTNPFIAAFQETKKQDTVNDLLS